MALAPETRFDRYEILYLLGAGGMGEVYLAQDTRLGRKIALKLLPERFTQDADRLRRFVQEAQAASGLNHPNIITIHEIGEVDGTEFIATEFIEGQTLRQQMTKTPLKLGFALDLAMQVASALAAAHAAGIVHRDIKPENIMVRPDGLVKVLDFGLAKLAESSTSPLDPEAPTAAGGNTETGAVLGTPRYMSPEQARGLKVDARTDIFSMGVVLYEMIAGRSPFEGATASEVIAVILHQDPPPLARFAREVPEALEWIVRKALAKDREERYQTVKDLALDLKGLKNRLEFETERERSGDSSGKEKAASSGSAMLQKPGPEATQTAERPPASTTSSVRIVLGEVKRHQFGAVIVLGLLIMATAIAFFYFNPKPVLTDKDTILLADFENKTGDEIFDGTLKQGLAVQLQQSPFLNLFPDGRVQQALRQMGHPPDERVTAEVAREICERQSLKALIAGSIAPLGRHYVITLEAINGQSGETLAREQVEAESKEQVLRTLSQAATGLREKLGESLTSIQRFDKPLGEEATTSKLDAFRAFSLGVEQSQRGRLMEAIPLYKRAVDIDTNFAHAYSVLSVVHWATGRPEVAAEYAKKGYALREKVGEYEKLRIANFYHGFATGDLDKRIELLMLQKRVYPRAATGPLDLCWTYLMIGRFDEATAEARESIRLNSYFSPSHRGLGLSLMRLGRFAEAKDVVTQALAQNLDTPDFHSILYQISFINGDTAGMKQEVDWASGKVDEHLALDWQTGVTAFVGQFRRAQELARRAIDLTARGDTNEIAARYATEQALRGIVFGNCAQAGVDATEALKFARGRASLPRVALALALCGETNQAKLLTDELTRVYPEDTIIHSIWLPTISAAMELQLGNAAQAVKLLQTVSRYEAAAEFWPQYVRGQAHLKLNQGAEAAVQFQKILGSRGQGPLSALYPLAHLGLARAAALTGAAAKSRKAYENFFALWKDADPDLPILREAKQEYEKSK